MNEVYVKLAITFIGSAIGIYLMNRHQNEKIRKARLDFERMMKDRGLSLEPITKGENDGNQGTENEPNQGDS